MNRKADHIKISLEKEVEVGSSGFEDVLLVHCAAPELNLEDIDLSVDFLGKKLKYPFIIEGMTGGTKEALDINSAMAEVAEEMGIGIGVGSQRPAIEDHKVEETYSVVKKAAKNALKIANLGAVQLNYGYGVEQCQAAVDMIAADALALHFNTLQEVVQPEGNTNFRDLLKKVKEVCAGVSVPVIAKEVGCGLSKTTGQKLLDTGVKCLDIGGFGGTSWNVIEGFRAEGEKAELSEVFKEWGIPTAASLLEVKSLKCPKIASGGVRSGVDAAKAIALGGDVVGMALPLLRALYEGGEDAVVDYLYQTAQELKVCMFLTGAKDIEALKKINYRLIGRTGKWATQI